MSELKTYTLLLVSRGFYAGSLEATSVDDAVARTIKHWCNDDPHPFEKDDEELISVIAEEENR